MYTVRINKVAINVIEVEIVDADFASCFSGFYQENGQFLSEDQEIEDYSDQDTIEYQVFLHYHEAKGFVNEFLYKSYKR